MSNNRVSPEIILVKPSMKIDYIEEYFIRSSLWSEGDGTVVTFGEQRKPEKDGESERTH